VHWSKIFRNVFSNWASYLVTAIVGFTLAPIVVHSLGNTGYGLWTLVLSLTGYFGLLDLGIRSSVGRFVTRHLALEDHQRVNATVSTAFAMLSAAGLLALMATLVMVEFFFGSFKVEPQYAASGRIALLITGLNMACILPFSVFSATLIGLERFDVVSGVTIVGELLRAALVVSSLRMGYGLVTLALISLFLTVSEYSAMAIFVKMFYRPLRLSFCFLDRTVFRELFGFGIYRFIWIVANQLIFYSDSVVIGVMLGAASITYYAIAGSLINYGRNVVSLVTDTLAPAAARLDAKEDRAGLQRLLVLGTKLALMIGMPLCLGFLFLGKQFITLWMGKAYASSAAYLAVLTIPQFGSMAQYTSALILAGMARHRSLAFFALAEGLANLILSVLLAQKIGLIGVAWGTVIPDLLCTTLVVPLYTLNVLKLSVRDYLRKAWLPPALCAVPVVGLGIAFSALSPAPSWLMFGAEAAAFCTVFGGMAYFVCLDSAQRARLVEKLGSMFRREAVVGEA
jgi:O-antigen/teichoic acid export membrane protein